MIGVGVERGSSMGDWRSGCLERRRERRESQKGKVSGKEERKRLSWEETSDYDREAGVLRAIPMQNVGKLEDCVTRCGDDRTERVRQNCWGVFVR